MLIDWFTVAAQTLNFVVLVWLLQRYLYKPVLRAIDAREKRIAAELAAAAAKQTEAQQQRDEFERKSSEFDRLRAATLAAVTQQADGERQRLLDAAHADAEALSAARRSQLAQESARLRDAVIRRTHDEVFAIARRTLADLAGVDLEQRMTEVFMRRLRELDGPDKMILAAALKTRTEPAVVVSAFEMPEPLRRAINAALRDAFSSDVPVRFETSPALINGVEMTVNGRSLSWSVADYLTTLGHGVDAAFATASATDTTRGEAA